MGTCLLFKQKTAYEVSECDWSSEVCSSDLAKRGTSYGAPCEDEVLLAREVIDALPSVEMVRMVNSGTEATMSALRLARGITGRAKVLKFVGCRQTGQRCF